MIPMRPVLDHYGINYHDRDTFQKILCPVHDERRPSCSLNLESGYFYCHACGNSGTALDLIVAREGIKREAAARLCESLTGTSDTRVPGGDDGKSGRVVRGQQGFVPRYRNRSQVGFRTSGGGWV